MNTKELEREHILFNVQYFIKNIQNLFNCYYLALPNCTPSVGAYY